MSWQDALLSSGGVIFALAMLPMVVSATKPPLLCSLPNAAFLTAYVGAYLTLHLYGAAAVTALTASVWTVLAWQARCRA